MAVRKASSAGVFRQIALNFGPYAVQKRIAEALFPSRLQAARTGGVPIS